MPESLTNTQLKNRLLGAALLVVLAVLLIPLFLGEPKQTEREVPTGDSNTFQSRIQPLPSAEKPAKPVEPSTSEVTVQTDPDSNTGLVLKKFDQLQANRQAPATPDLAPQIPVEQQAAQNQAAQATAKPSSEPQIIAPKPATPKPVAPKKVVKTAPPKTNAAPAPVRKTPIKKEPTPSAKSGWVVQAGIFSKSENAKLIAKTLRSNGHKPNLSEAKTSFGKATRVWIGPFTNKAEAKKVSDTIEQQTGNGGYVAEYPFKS